MSNADECKTTTSQATMASQTVLTIAVLLISGSIMGNLAAARQVPLATSDHPRLLEQVDEAHTGMCAKE